MNKEKVKKERDTDEEKEVNKVSYKITKKVAKKAITIAKYKAYERLPQKLNIEEG